MTETISNEILEQAKELGRGAEILPGGISGLAQKLEIGRKEKRPLRVKLGIDPTSTDLHIGHAVVVRKLRRFQEFGHKVVIIIGGFTAQIGDPSGRNATRPPLTAEEVNANAETYLNQIGLILDLKETEVRNNADWLSPLSLNEIIKLASRVTTSQLLAKEAFGDRLEKQQPIAFHELFYPLLQAYDSVAIKADIEFGGTDQRFNLLQGRELQPHYGQPAQLALLMPLLVGTDGEKKMSKSYNNYIALKEIPSEMFGKCMRIPDGLLVNYFELATTLSGREIDQIKHDLETGKNPKDIKEKLAGQIVKQYHGEDAAHQALEEWRRVHSERQLPDEMPLHTVIAPTQLFRLLAESNLASGTSESKRLVNEGAVRLNGQVVKDPNQMVETPGSDGIVLQVGRRKFVKLIAK